MLLVLASILFVPWTQACPSGSTDANLTTPAAIAQWNATHTGSPGIPDETVDPRFATRYRTCVQ